MPFKFNPFTGTLDEVNLSTGAQGPAGPSGATGPSGPPGTPGVVSGTVPITYDSGTQTIGITAATTTVAGSMSANDKTKLDGIASGATANSSDAFLLSRTNHTGTQSGATVTGFYTAAGLTMNTARILGRTTASSGAAEEITIGSGLVLSGGTLVATATGSGGTGTPGGSTTQVQFNDSGSFAGDADLTWDKTANVLTVSGDVNLNDGGAFTTTLQTITATAARTISFPDATGTVALIGGSSGQLIYNNAGVYAGASTLTYDGSILTSNGRFINSYNATASSPAKAFTGTWFTGGTATTTKPQVLIEPIGATSTAWSTSGTALGVNASSGFAGNLLDLQVNGTSRFSIAQNGGISFANYTLVPDNNIVSGPRLSSGLWVQGGDGFALGANASYLSANTTNVIAINERNVASSSTLLVYNTRSSATSFERGKLEWSSNTFRIGTEKGSGGGTARNVEVQTDSISRLALDTTGSVRVVTALTVATLPGTPAVGMIARVTDATAPVVGATVTGGGAAAALCWYNGANWSVIGV